MTSPREELQDSDAPTSGVVEASITAGAGTG